MPLVVSTSANSRFKESTCINKSLLTLGKIICLLSDRQTGQQPTGPNNHLPYRESVLTWLLRESIGGNAKTAMLATVNASSCYLDETLCTLRYAAKTANIKNIACLNRNFKQKYVNELGQEMEMTLMLPQAHNEFETLKQMELVWKEKLEEAERMKIKEINDLEKSLIGLYENETRAQNSCLINLNEDPSLSEKLIYLLKVDSDDGSESVTFIGSDKAKVHIHLTGALIAPVHSKIICKRRKSEDEKFYIEKVDGNYVTYINGEDALERRELFHGDRIIFGGSHYFRFNNPKSKLNNSQNNSTNNSLSGGVIEFKDYQFAKNEIERKQNELMEKKVSEELEKCKRDGDNRIKELKMIYERDIESIVNLLYFFCFTFNLKI